MTNLQFVTSSKSGSAQVRLKYPSSFSEPQAPALPGSALGTFRTPIAFAGWVVRGVINMAGRYQGFHSLNTGNIEIFWRADGWCWWSRAPGCPSVSTPVGPFLTSTDAYLHANGGACLIPRPATIDRVA